MRQTKGNLELSNNYNPKEIGMRMLIRMEELKIPLRGFAFLMQYCPSGYYNLNRYVSAAKQNQLVSLAKEEEGILDGLGKYFLDYAINSYLIAFALNTDVLYLATGSEQNHPEGFPRVCCYGHTDGLNLTLAWLAGSIKPEEIAARIRRTRKRCGYRITDMLEPLHVSLVTYSNYENPKEDQPQRFSYPVFSELCSFLGAEQDEIMLGKPISEMFDLEKEAQQAGYQPRVINPMNEITPETVSYTAGMAKEMETVIELPPKSEPLPDAGPESQGMEFYTSTEAPDVSGRDRVEYISGLVKKNRYNDCEHRSLDELVRAYNWIMKNLEEFSPEDLQGIRECVAENGYVVTSREGDRPERTEICLKQAWENSRWLKQRLEDFDIVTVCSVYDTMSRLYPDLTGSLVNRYPADR